MSLECPSLGSPWVKKETPVSPTHVSKEVAGLLGGKSPYEFQDLCQRHRGLLFVSECWESKPLMCLAQILHMLGEHSTTAD